MELKEIKAITNGIGQELQDRPQGLVYRKYDTFLDWFGMANRRDWDVIKKIDYQLKKQGVTVWCGREQRTSVGDFKRGESITFRIEVDNNGTNEHHKTGSKQVETPNAGTIQVSNTESGLTLYKHQEEAVQQLTTKIIKTDKNPFAGLVVLPTGGGKTLTAAYWLCKNLLDKNKKVLWLAHRHELLDQAKSTFHERLAFNDIFTSRTSFNYRILSGIHDRPINVKTTDDIIISSTGSLTSGFDHLLKKWIIGSTKEIFLVVDEAHHATAKTYRRIINQLRENVDKFRMLGLTATPFRTAENEQGLLSKVFPDDIVYKVDLRTLINRGILSEPVFEEVNTHIDFTSQFNERQFDKINQLDISSLGDEVVRTIAENKERNLAIVQRYAQNRDKYKQTIVFALNQSNAIALSALFRKEGVNADYVMSSIRDRATGVTISNKENKAKIDQFRKGDLEVLINVNILTEGTDLPQVQSVFLARPTISPILMTQMIGRGLRGERAGGTAKAYIVSFIDDWKDKVAWVNPEKLLIEENVDFTERDVETRKQLIRLISINKIEEFAVLANKIIDAETKKGLENLDFIERVPVGIYHFAYLAQIDGNEPQEKNCEILVYNNIRQSYEDFVSSIPDFFKQNRLMSKESLTDSELEILSTKVQSEFFHGCELYPGYRKEDIKDVLQFYAQNESIPKYIELKDRAKYDLTKVANEIINGNYSRASQAEFVSKLWEGNEVEWKAFFGYDKRYFLGEIDLAIRRIENPELYQKPSVIPTDKKELRALESLSMSELRDHNPEYWKWLSDTVYEKHQDSEGYYVSAGNGYRSKRKLDFQIDHIRPISSGGLTTLDNLQLLTRNENAQKGSAEDPER